MKKIKSILILFLFASTYLQAQKATPNKWRYASLTQGGIATGSNTISYTAQTIQGIQKNNWFTGIGIGIDGQGISSFPLVAHVQKSFTNKRFQPFAYSQAGVQFAWKKGQWDAKTGYETNEDIYKISTGYLAEIGAGYKIPLGQTQTHAFVISAGYSFKTNKVQERNLIGYCGTPPLPIDFSPAPYFYTRHSNSRLVLKAGFFF